MTTVEVVETHTGTPQYPSWVVPAAAQGEWAVLQAALSEMWPLVPPCADDPELFFASSNSTKRAEAVDLCQSCPIRAQCLSYAVAAAEREGIWGGLTAAERRAAVEAG